MRRHTIRSFAVVIAMTGCADAVDPLALDNIQVFAASQVGVYTAIKIDRIDMGQGRAFAINDAGVATGYTTGRSGDQVFRWTKANGMQSLGLAGQAFDINAAGDITGRSGLHAFFRWNSGTVVDLGTLSGGNDSDGHALNDARRRRAKRQRAGAARVPLDITRSATGHPRVLLLAACLQ